MKDDVISRQAALNTVEKMYKMCEGNLSDYHDLLVACFTDLTPAQRWIPVTPETEPKENGEYLVTRESKGLYRYLDIVKKSNVTDKIAGDIVAYMPLPEPWKGER